MVIHMHFFKSKPDEGQALLKGNVTFTGLSNLPKPFRKPEKKDIELDVFLQRLKKLSQYSIRQMDEASLIVANLNRFNFKAEQRQIIIEELVRFIYPTIAAIYEKYQSKHNSLPESEGRRQSLSSAIELVTQFSNTYKLSVTGFLNKDGKVTAKQAKNCHYAAFRSLELILITQRLRALRYQKLSRESWVDLNQLFFILARHKLITEKYPMFGTIGINNRNHNNNNPYQQSVQYLYISLQIFGVLDVSTWPTHLFHVPDSYLESLDTGVEFLTGDHQNLPEGFLYAWEDQNTPAIFQQPDIIKKQLVIIDYTRYYNSIIKDFEVIGEMSFINKFDEKRLSRPIAKVNDEDRVPLLQNILTSLRQRERKSRRHVVFQDNKVTVYFGLADIISLFRNEANSEIRKRLHSRELRDTIGALTDNSMPYQHNPLSAQWELVNFSAGGILISSMEINFGYSIHMGQLVAFKTDGQTGQLALGFVCRLNRPQDRLVEVGINRLSSYAEIVIIEGAGDTELYIPALLIQDNAGGWQVVIQPNHQVQPGMPLKLYRGNKTSPARMGDLLLSKKEFTLYEFRSPGLVL